MNGKRYTKRIFSLLIVCTLLVTLTGCTGNQADMSLKRIMTGKRRLYDGWMRMEIH